VGAEEVWHGGPASVPFPAVVFDCSSPPLQMSHTGADSTAARPRSANIVHVCRQPLSWVFGKHFCYQRILQQRTPLQNLLEGGAKGGVRAVRVGLSQYWSWVITE